MSVRIVSLVLLSGLVLLTKASTTSINRPSNLFPEQSIGRSVNQVQEKDIMCAPDKPNEKDNKTEATVNKNDDDSKESTVTNKKWILKARPNGIFNPTTDVELLTETLSLSSSSCPEDEVIVKVDMLSVDAFIRTMLDAEAYHGSVDLGKVLPAIGYGTVVHVGSKVQGFKVGTVVQGMLGAQTYAVAKTAMLQAKPRIPFVSDTASLGLLGLTTGLTAYVGTFYVTSPPRRKETVVVSAAAGAVGSVASQLAKTTGARVIGVAGGTKKTAYLVDDLQLDGAVDYKCKKRTIEEQLDELCPNGIDFFYDNVGGELLDAVLSKINNKGRVVVCGAISQYSGNLNKGKVRGPANYLKLAERGASMAGFNVMQYMSQILKAVFFLLWFHITGKVKVTEHIEEGLENFPVAMEKMFGGGHIGKMLVNVRGST